MRRPWNRPTSKQGQAWKVIPGNHSPVAPRLEEAERVVPAAQQGRGAEQLDLGKGLSTQKGLKDPGIVNDLLTRMIMTASRWGPSKRHVKAPTYKSKHEGAVEKAKMNVRRRQRGLDELHGSSGRGRSGILYATVVYVYVWYTGKNDTTQACVRDKDYEHSWQFFSFP